jgi:hypothetical protein
MSAFISEGLPTQAICRLGSRKSSLGRTTDSAMLRVNIVRFWTRLERPFHNHWMGSSKSRRSSKRSKRSPERHLPPVRGGRMDAIPAGNPMTPEGYIQGIGNFANGLKRLLRRGRRK